MLRTSLLVFASPQQMPPPPASPAPLPFKWGAQHCITDPLTGKKACVVMPYGYDINSNDPTVKRAMTLAFRTEPLGNTFYVPPPSPSPLPP